MAGPPRRISLARIALGASAALLSVVPSLAEPPGVVAPRPESTAPRADGSDTTSLRGQAYYHLMRASIAAREGRVAEMLEELGAANRAQPRSAELRAESANLLMTLGQTVEAERFARQALELDPRQPAALRLLAGMAATRALAGTGEIRDRDEAIALYTRLAEGGDADDDTLRTLTRLRRDAGDLEGALEAARALAERRKGDVRVTHLIVRMQIDAGHDLEALETILNFVARYGEEDRLLPLVSELTKEPAQWEVVSSICTRLLAADPDNLSLRKLRGEAMFQLGDYAAAVEELERALESGSDDPLLLFQLTNGYRAVRRLADATETARALAASLPGNPNVQTILADALIRQRDLPGALAVLGAALEGFGVDEPGGPAKRDEVRRRMAVIELERDRTDEAERLLGGLEQPDAVEGLELRLRVALDGGRIDAARELLAKLRAQDEPGLVALFDGELFAREDRVGKARSRFREAASRLGTMVWPRVAETWRSLDRPAEGERVLRAWVRDEPENVEAHFALGGFLEREGDFDGAEPLLRSALRLEPDHANALNYLGYSLADRNRDLDEALELILRALELDPWNGAFLDSLGWVYYRMGRYHDAREPLERAAREFPHDPIVLDHLGDLYDRLGEWDLALEAWRRAISADPEDPQAIRSKIREGERRRREDRARAEVEPPRGLRDAPRP